MKKLVFVIPLMAISLLASCGGGSNPIDPTVYYTIKFSENSLNCKMYDVVEPYGEVTSKEWEAGEVARYKIKGNNGYGFPSEEQVMFTTDDGEAFDGLHSYDPSTGELSVKMTANVTITANTTDYHWYLDNDYLNNLTLEDVTKEGGEVQTLKVNGLDHKVHLIGVDEDLDANNNTIHTTWEFMNLISDSFGNSLGTQWNNTDVSAGSNYNYLNSPIRQALNGTGDATHFLWAEYEKGATTSSWSTTYVTSVLDMIGKGNPGLISLLIAPKKTVMCKSDGIWVPTEIKTGDDYDKLFLLSPGEMGFSGTQDKAYTYYGNCTKQTDPNRIKKQFNESTIETFNNEDNIPTLPVGEEGFAFNYSGYNKETDWTGGGLFWSRSPGTVSDNTAWRISSRGMLFNSCPVNNYAIGVAPAFCL